MKKTGVVTVGTLTIFRSDYQRIMQLASYKAIKRLFLALVLYTDKQGVYTGWTPDGRLTIYGPEDSIEKVREFVRGKTN